MSIDTESKGPDGDAVRVAEYVLGVLDAQEHAEVAALIDNDPAHQAEARFWQSRLSSLDTDFAEVTPPATLLRGIEDRLFGPKPGLWNNIVLWRAVAGGALAIAVLAVGFGVLQPSTLAPSPSVVQLAATLEAQDSDVKFLAVYDDTTGNLRIAGLSGEDVPGRDYELWLIDGDTPPVSLGLIPVDARSEVTLTPDMRAVMAEGTVFAVTLEPDGGAPQGIATGPVVAVGAVSAI